MPKKILLEKISREEMIDHMNDLYKFAVKKLDKINRKPKIFLNNDKKNADDFFGKTGFYDPEKEEIHLFVTDRHPKDILRSFSHELVHHEQNCSGYTATVDMNKTHQPDYASHDPKLREAEREAFERGNMIFRDWTDSIKAQRGDKNMKDSQLKSMIKEMIKEMSKRQVKIGHKIGKAIEADPKSKADKPFAVGMAAAKNLDETEEEWKARRDAAIKKAMKKDKKKDPVKEAEALARKHAKKTIEQKTGKDLKRMKKESAAESTEKLQESRQLGGIVELKPISDKEENNYPYPQLFDKKERALKDAFEQKDERVYQELMKRFGFNKNGDK